MKVSDENIARNQAYEARGVVAKYHAIGHYQSGPAIRIPVYKFLTLYQGPGRDSIPVEFVRPAPMLIGKNGERYLNTEAVEVGHFVINPGLVYRRCLWFDNLMAEHIRALQLYKPKDIIIADKDDAPPVDLGTLDATTDQVTKQ